MISGKKLVILKNGIAILYESDELKGELRVLKDALVVLNGSTIRLEELVVKEFEIAGWGKNPALFLP
ncbi:MAG TPA: hypothetical protein ENK81_02980 [Euryarchaeota archaeon]|nr:hypothetical protein [Euryarchaeota archaeon]